jgi:hypothetical protein
MFEFFFLHSCCKLRHIDDYFNFVLLAKFISSDTLIIFICMHFRKRRITVEEDQEKRITVEENQEKKNNR